MRACLSFYQHRILRHFRSGMRRNQNCVLSFSFLFFNFAFPFPTFSCLFAAVIYTFELYFGIVNCSSKLNCHKQPVKGFETSVVKCGCQTFGLGFGLKEREGTGQTVISDGSPLKSFQDSAYWLSPLVSKVKNYCAILNHYNDCITRKNFLIILQ